MSSVPQTEDDHQYPQTLSVPTVFDMYWPRLQATRHKRHILKVLTVEFDVPVAAWRKLNCHLWSKHGGTMTYIL